MVCLVGAKAKRDSWEPDTASALAVSELLETSDVTQWPFAVIPVAVTQNSRTRTHFERLLAFLVHSSHHQPHYSLLADADPNAALPPSSNRLFPPRGGRGLRTTSDELAFPL
jgi:hypothetical protein